MNSVLSIGIFIIGLCFGSFANVIIYRVPRGISIVKPRSACTACGKTLGAVDLLPVLSWLFLRGKCRACGAKISPQYPLVELMCAVLFVAMFMHSPTLSFLPLAVFAFVLLTISFIDAYTQEIPDGLIITGAVAGILWIASGHLTHWQDALLGVIAGAVPLFVIDRLTLIILKKDGFGFGDVKLMAMVGLFLGWRMVFLAFFIAFVLGAIFAVYLIASGKAKRESYMAFAPFLCIGTLTAFWFGEWLLAVYFGLNII